MNKKGKNQSIASMIILLIALWFGAFLIVSIIGIIHDPITFAIQLNQKEIPLGADGILTYSIKNYGFQEIQNVTVGTEIFTLADNQFVSRDFNNLAFLQSSTGAYLFKTTKLQRGSYIVKSVLIYRDSSNNEQRRELTLGFTII